MCSFNGMLNEAFYALVNSVLASVWMLDYYIRMTLNGRRSQVENQRKKERYRQIVAGEDNCKHNGSATTEAENRGIASRQMLKGNMICHMLQNTILYSLFSCHFFHSFLPRFPSPFVMLYIDFIITITKFFTVGVYT